MELKGCASASDLSLVYCLNSVAVSLYAIIWFGLRGKGHRVILKLHCNAQFSSNEDYLIYIWKPVPTANAKITKEGVCRTGAASGKEIEIYSARTLILYKHVNYYHWNNDIKKLIKSWLTILVFFVIKLIISSKLTSIAFAGMRWHAALKGNNDR